MPGAGVQPAAWRGIEASFVGKAYRYGDFDENSSRWGEIHRHFRDVMRAVALAGDGIARKQAILDAGDQIFPLIRAGEIKPRYAVDGLCAIARSHGLLTEGVEEEIGHRLRGKIGAWREAAEEYHANRAPDLTNAPPIVAGGSPESDRDWAEFDRRERECPSLTEHQQFLRGVVDPTVTMDRAYWAIQARHRSQATPQTTVDAILVAVGARGLATLQEPAVRERVFRCDASARQQINEGIERLLAKGEIR